MGLRDLFRRNTVNDPFGGDDGFDGESRFAGQGPKIALIASGVLFLVLVGGGAAILMTGDENAATPPIAGSLADLEVVEDEDAPAPPPAQAAAPAATAPVIADSTAATDRSVERRPWLAAPAPTAPRPGMDVKPAAPAVKPAAPVTPPPAAQAKAAPTPPAAAPPAATPPAAMAAKPATPPPAAAKPAEVKTAEAKPAESKPAVMAPPAATAPAPAPKTATPAPAATPATQTATAEAKPQSAAAAALLATLPPEDETPDPTRDIAGIPALRQADEAPGAPRRFDTPKGDAGPAIAGGRPRLVEPPLPPTDKIAIAAPPPRYANLTDVKAVTNAAAPPAAASKVAFIVDGLGLSQSATEAAINKLPANVTLAFSPYARNLKKWVEQAKAKGHEVLIEVPMESKQFPSEDPGPLGLLTSIEAKENTERLEAILKESAGTVGVLDTMGSKFRESGEHINPVFAKLKESNLVYVQGTPGVRVGEASVPTAIADVIIDERPFRAAIDARLDYAERLAKYQGSAVVSMGAKPVNFERLILWAEQAQKKGIVLAPISQVLIKQ